jgi:hypothetical protein
MLLVNIINILIKMNLGPKVDYVSEPEEEEEEKAVYTKELTFDTIV